MSNFQQDNLQLNPGVGGAFVGTDFISNFGQGSGSTGAHLQVVKLAYGAFENATLASGNTKHHIASITGSKNIF